MASAELSVPVRAGRLLTAEGGGEREMEQAEVPISQLIALRLIDRSELLNQQIRRTVVPELQH